MGEVNGRDAIVRELVGASLGEFTALRNARVRELKASGAGALAAEVQKLRRPALPLWAANQLARQPEVLADVREATLEAADAQARGSAGDLREAMARLQRALDRAAETAAGILDVSGHRGTDEARLRVREIVRLAALHEGEWERLATGVLTEVPAPDVGFGMLPVGAARPAPPATPATDGDTEADALRQREAREAAVEAARRRVAEDVEAAEQAVAHAARLRKRAIDLAEEARGAEERAATAEDEARRARDAASESQAVLGRLSEEGEEASRG